MKTIIRQNVFVKPETSKIAQGCVIVGTGDTTDMLLAQRISANVRYWHKADITTAPIHVRFGGKADIAIAGIDPSTVQQISRPFDASDGIAHSRPHKIGSSNDSMQ